MQSEGFGSYGSLASGAIGTVDFSSSESQPNLFANSNPAAGDAGTPTPSIVTAN